MKAAKTVYRRANTLQEAVEIAQRANGAAKFLAGGQSLLPMMNLRAVMPEAVIDIAAIAALREVRPLEGKLFVGAGVTHAMVEDGKVEDPARGYLRHVAGGIAYRSVRNRGTVGGSIAHADPAGDWPSALLALGAIALIHGAQGERRVPLADFQVGLMETRLGEHEILQGLLLPVLSAEARWSYLKFSRKVGEFAHSIGALVIDRKLKLANAVLGAAGEKPRLLPGLCARLAAGVSAAEVAGKAFGELVDQDLATVTEHERSSYEFHLHKTMITRAVIEALQK